MKFLIQHNMINSKNLEQIKEALKDIPHEFVGVIPFSDEITSNEPLVGENYIPYGSTLMTNLASQYKWKGLHFNLENFNYSKAASRRSDMLNDGDGDIVLRLKHAISILECEEPETLWFLRPSEDLKQFSGVVMEAGEAAAWLKDCMECESSGSYKLDASTKIVLAEPKNIQAEWRWFIIGGKVVDGSMYRFNGILQPKHEDDPLVIAEAQRLATGWLPDQCCVMDTALVDDKLYVIEFNTINSSGFYDSDIDKIFKEWYNFEILNKPKMKKECYKCQYYTNNKNHSYYRCSVVGHCPALEKK